MRLLQRYPGFRHVFWGQLASQFGNAVFLIMGLWEIQLRAPFLLAVAGLAMMVPNVLAVLGGALVDMHDPRRLMLWTDIVRGAAVGLGMLALLLHAPLIPVIIGLLAVNSLGSALFAPAEQVILPWLVEDRDLGEANGVYSLTFQLSGAVGSFIGGAAIAAIGLQVIFGLDLASFWLSGLAIWLMMRIVALRPRAVSRGATGSGQNLLVVLRDGLRALSVMPWLIRLLPIIMLTNFAFAAAFTMFPYWCRHVLHVGSVGYGSVDAAWAVGLVAGSLLVGRFNGWSFRSVTVFLGTLMGVTILAFSATRAAVPAAGLLLLAGAANGVLNAIVITIMQRLVPDALRGRAFGAFAALLTMSQPAGAILSGVLLHVAPLWWPWAAAGAASLGLAVMASRELPASRVGGTEADALAPLQSVPD
jgi:predicted MFS family arabinose efflux permease